MAMKTRLLMNLALAGALSGWSGALAAEDAPAPGGSLRQKLIGTWHMVSMEEEEPDGTMTHHTERSGMLIYTADGHVAVQVMYPESEIGASANASYQQGGYEASFGSYEVNEQTSTITNHYEASLVRRLIGKPLLRVMQFSPDGHLTLHAADPKEKWSVTWERY
jgi:hypothetical protein